ncbi:MAG: hypothetical protein JWN52_5894 [Actinomycetia bacterium]|nr:hypothetical protein [Actinomycetes bacterium]
MRKTLQRTALTGGVAVVTLTGTLAPAGAAAPAWRIVHTNTAKTVGPDTNVLADITAIGAKDVWTVGSVSRNAGQYNHSLAQHWNGTKWTDTTLPVQFRKSNTIASGLNVVASSSSKNVWAFGSSGPVNGASRSQYALHWDGKHWTVAHSWKTWSWIYKAVVLSPTNVWAFSGAGDTFGAWHFDGKTWTKVKTPGFQVITASAVSPTNIWAVVSKPTARTDDGRFVARYNGHAWSLVKTPDIPGTWEDTPEYNAVHAQSSKDVWVVGGRQITTSTDGQVAPIALHWNGTEWQRFDGPLGAHNLAGLYSVVPDGKGGIWGTRGSFYEGDPVHLVGGKWTATALPKVKGKAVSVEKLAHVPGTTSIWGAGLLTWGGLPDTNGVVFKYS